MTYGQYGKPKQCQNNCGQEIAWDKQAGYFVNTSNSVRHDCPKWEKKSSAGFAPNTNAAAAEGGAMEILTRIENKLDKLEQIGSMGNWLQEKIAKKVGVEDLTDDSIKQ